MLKQTFHQNGRPLWQKHMRIINSLHNFNEINMIETNATSPSYQPTLSTTQYKWVVGYTYYNASHILMTWGWLLLKQRYKVSPGERERDGIENEGLMFHNLISDHSQTKFTLSETFSWKTSSSPLTTLPVHKTSWHTSQVAPQKIPFQWREMSST